MDPYAYVAMLGVLLWLVAVRIDRLAETLRLPRGLSVLVTLATVSYLSGLAPGILGVLSSGAILVTLAVFAGLLVLAASWLGRPCPVAGDTADVDGGDLGRWESADVVLAAFGLVGCGPLLHELGFAIPFALLFPSEAKVGTDVASYHLPCMVRFFQAGTLWDLRNSWQSYSYGYEIIGNLPSMAFHKTWGLWMGHLLALGLSVASLVHITAQVVWAWKPVRPVKVAPVAAMVVGLWSLAFSHAIHQVGKNDVFLAASVLAGLAFALEWSQDVNAVSASPLRQRVLLALAGMSLGLAFATKPTAAVYVLAFPLTVASVRLASSRGTVRGRMVRALGDGAIVGGLAVALGGFFPIRNLLMVGSLSALRGGYRDVLAPHLLEGFVYRLRPVSLGFVFGAVAFSVAMVAGRLRRCGPGRRTVLVVFGMFLMAATATFVLSPNVILHDFYNVRFAICMMACAMVVAAIVGAQVLAGFFRLRPILRAVLAGLVGVAGILGLAAHWSRAPVVGLPQQDTTWQGLPTGIYAWADSLTGSRRIFVVGMLYPLGFQGKDWRHDVVAPPLADFPGAQEHTGEDIPYVAAAIGAYRPNVVVSSTEDHHGDIARWLEEHPEWFEAAYRDGSAVAFHVRPLAYEALRTAFANPRSEAR